MARQEAGRKSVDSWARICYTRSRLSDDTKAGLGNPVGVLSPFIRDTLIEADTIPRDFLPLPPRCKPYLAKAPIVLGM